MTTEPRKEGLSALITVAPSMAYGRTIFKPLNDLAVGLAEFAQTKNFSENHIKQLVGLGFKVEVVTPSIKGVTDK